MRRTQHGFTLVEMMWAAALTLIVLAAVFAALRVGLLGGLNITRSVQFGDEGTTAARIIERYLRQAMVLSETDDNYIRFSIEDSVQDNVYKTIEIGINGSELYYTVDGNKYVLSENLQNYFTGDSVFTYIANDGNTITDPTLRKSQTTMIRVHLIFDDDLDSPPPAFEVTTDISLRNFNI